MTPEALNRTRHFSRMIPCKAGANRLFRSVEIHPPKFPPSVSAPLLKSLRPSNQGLADTRRHLLYLRLRPGPLTSAFTFLCVSPVPSSCYLPTLVLFSSGIAVRRIET